MKVKDDLDLKVIGIKMCNTRLEKGISKKKMKEEYNINNHTLNKIEAGEYSGVKPFIQYCNSVGYEVEIKKKP